MNPFYSNLGLLNLAQRTGQGRTVLRRSRLTLAFLDLLRTHGLLAGYETLPGPGAPSLAVLLKPTLRFHLQPLATPSRRWDRPRRTLAPLAARSTLLCLSNGREGLVLVGTALGAPLAPGGLPLVAIHLRRP
jgi:hypothetical protein